MFQEIEDRGCQPSTICIVLQQSSAIPLNSDEVCQHPCDAVDDEAGCWIQFLRSVLDAAAAVLESADFFDQT